MKDVLESMRQRQADGKARSVRYKADDSARLKFINSVQLKFIYLGKLPSQHDMDLFRCGPLRDLQGVQNDQISLSLSLSLSLSSLSVHVCISVFMSFQ